jgi:hypothetical protein
VGRPDELHLLLDLLGVLAVEADVPARREQGLVDEAATRGLLVELEGRGDLLTLARSLVSSLAFSSAVRVASVAVRSASSRFGSPRRAA